MKKVYILKCIFIIFSISLVFLLVELVASLSSTCTANCCLCTHWSSFRFCCCYLSWCQLSFVCCYPWSCYLDIVSVSCWNCVWWSIASSCSRRWLNTQVSSCSFHLDVLTWVNILSRSISSWTVGKVSWNFNTWAVWWEILFSAMDHTNIIGICIDVSSKVGSIGLNIRLRTDLLSFLFRTVIGMYWAFRTDHMNFSIFGHLPNSWLKFSIVSF